MLSPWFYIRALGCVWWLKREKWIIDHPHGKWRKEKPLTVIPTMQSYYKIESDLFDIQFNNDWPICHSNDITQREIQLCSKWTSLSVRYSVIPSRHQLLYRICQSIKNNCLELFINVFACVFVLLVLFFTKFIDCLIPNWTTVTIEAILS